MTRHPRLAGLALLALLAGGCSSPASPPPRTPPSPAAPARPAVDLSIRLIPDLLHAAPLLTPRGELWQLKYRLNLSNDGARALTLQHIELVTMRGGAVLERRRLERPLLARQLRPAPWIVMRDRQTLAAAHRWRGELTRPKGDTLVGPGEAISLTRQHSLHRADELPDRLIVRATTGQGTSELSVEVLRHKQRVTLRLPVQGRWQVLAGHRFDETHGQAFVRSQTYAYDLGRVGADLCTHPPDTDRRLNASYLAHGQPILAAADGKVALVHDGVPDNAPVGRRPSWQTLLNRPRDLAGNFVVIDHGAGEFTAYMHLARGLKVTAGQKVRAGEVIGRCGNSGNSSEPHLHFQLQDGPDPLRAAGLPARFSDVTFQWARLRIHAPTSRGIALPAGAPVAPGKAEGAVDLERWLVQK